jgi:hypothetical protein
MSEPLIIGIGHVRRAGKDTAAQAIMQRWPADVVRIGFADALKELALGADPLIVAAGPTNVGVGKSHLKGLVAALGWEHAKDQLPEVRRFLQNLGESARNTFGVNFWVERVMRAVEDTGAKIVVIPDVRYISELETIQAAGGKVIKIHRPGFRAEGHVSETELSAVPDEAWDAVIENSGTVVDLGAAVVGCVEKWISGRR